MSNLYLQYLAIALPLFLGMVFICIVLRVVHGVLKVLLGKSGGYAPGWQLRCTSCNRTRDAAEVGIVRIGAASVGKRTLGWCSACRRLRAIAIERKPQSDSRHPLSAASPRTRGTES